MNPWAPRTNPASLCRLSLSHKHLWRPNERVGDVSTCHLTWAVGQSCRLLTTTLASSACGQRTYTINHWWCSSSAILASLKNTWVGGWKKSIVMRMNCTKVLSVPGWMPTARLVVHYCRGRYYAYINGLFSNLFKFNTSWKKNVFHNSRLRFSWTLY